MADEETWSCDAEILREAGKCWVIRVESGEEVLIPKIAIHDDSEVYSLKARSGRLVIPLWLAKDRGLA
jgi:hypothetical protein